jgi:hypothetical protein
MKFAITITRCRRRLDFSASGVKKILKSRLLAMCSHLVYNKLAIAQLLLLTDGKELSGVLVSALLSLSSSVEWNIVMHNSRAPCANARHAYLAIFEGRDISRECRLGGRPGCSNTGTSGLLLDALADKGRFVSQGWVALSGLCNGSHFCPQLDGLLEVTLVIY